MPNARLDAARAYVLKKPSDRFGLYTLAMELRKEALWPECFAIFERLLLENPNYGAGWYHFGMSRHESGDTAGAVATLREGLSRGVDAHARSEIEGAIETLESEA